MSFKHKKGTEVDIQSIGKIVREKEHFVLATHVQPDGDAVGSILSLGLTLKGLGKKVFMSLGQPQTLGKQNAEKGSLVPPQYLFLPGKNLLSKPSQCPDETKCFISLDCASFERLGSLKQFAKNASLFINIDHHRDNDKFAHLNFVDEESPATAEIVYRLIKALDYEIDKDIATCLYVGLVTDTGRFQYSNTNKAAFQMALELLDYGISPSFVFSNVYENTSFSYLKLFGKILQNIKFASGVAYTTLKKNDLVSLGVKIEETENLVDALRSIGDAKVAAILKEVDGGRWKVSLRSKNEIDVSGVAKALGGGGHRNAAGYLSRENREDTIRTMLEALKDL
ncbi:MAG TPA: bifunctional oligoribonuclease/PAP phosphatase NrnA [Actinobacteria bacterium]|nr:bifunctional oligoribonuclease/PAP phosphatase NrnA [Actinomycetota bacterium]